MYEHFFTCPYCHENISMLLDISLPGTKYIEDCEVCCNPIEIHYGFNNGELVFFEADEIGQ